MQANLSPQPPRTQPVMVIPQDVPVYRVTDPKGFYGSDDQLHPEGAFVQWEDEPNQGLEPMNALALDAMKTYLAKLDETGRAQAEKAGRAYQSQADAFENARLIAQEESRSVSLKPEGQQVPLMRGQKRTAKNIRRIEPQAAAEGIRKPRANKAEREGLM